MTRLIDADALYDKTMLKMGLFDNQDRDIFLDAIDEQPTAYNVDKVVEELGEATWQYNPPFNDEPYRMVILSNKAVQIVKRGGIDEI